MASLAQALTASRPGGVLVIMDTVLFTDHGIVVFAIITSAIALIFSVLGLETTHQIRSEIENQFEGGNSPGEYMSDDRGVSEWNLLKEQFHALVRKRPDNIEDILDAQFRGRFSALIYQAAQRKTVRL